MHIFHVFDERVLVSVSVVAHVTLKLPLILHRWHTKRKCDVMHAFHVLPQVNAVHVALLTPVALESTGRRVCCDVMVAVDVQLQVVGSSVALVALVTLELAFMLQLTLPDVTSLGTVFLPVVAVQISCRVVDAVANLTDEHTKLPLKTRKYPGQFTK